MQKHIEKIDLFLEIYYKNKQEKKASSIDYVKFSNKFGITLKTTPFKNLKYHI